MVRMTDIKPLPDDYSMFSDSGNRAVKAIVAAALALPISTPSQELYAFLNTEMRKIETAHDEIFDTDVRSAMIGAIERRTGRNLSIYF